MTYALIGLAVAALGMWLIWWATRFRTAQSPWWLRLALVIISGFGLVAALVGFRFAFAA